MSCLECKRADACHSERQKDITDLGAAIKQLNNGWINQAIEDFDSLRNRMEKRFLECTSRKI
jgi:hypothetical protein